MKRRGKIDLKKLEDTPPWEWPEGAAKVILEVLRNDRAAESERLLAAELAGDLNVINDEFANALLSIACSGKESETLRGVAVLSLGPALEYADMDEFEDPDELPISEKTFCGIQESLQALYTDAAIPVELRRQALETSVRAPQEWHENAIRAAYLSGDDAWRLTAVFGMRFVCGFNDQILEAMRSKNQDMHYQAVCAAGNWEIDAAWSHIAGLVTAEETDKVLRLAAIDAVAFIRPHEAVDILADLTDSEDEDIAEAACEAMDMAEGISDEEFGDEEDEPLR